MRDRIKLCTKSTHFAPRGMPHSPRRRFQFRLSTWFVLVAIVEWPWVIKKQSLMTWPANGQLVVQRAAAYTAFRESGPDLPNMIIFEKPYSPSANLLYPALALVAFVGWKAAWAIGRRERGEADDSLREAAHVPSRY